MFQLIESAAGLICGSLSACLHFLKIKLPASAKKLIATYPIPQTLDDIPDIPVFPNEESRLEFEKKEITVVDLSQTDNMYKTHVIEQVGTFINQTDKLLILILL